MTLQEGIADPLAPIARLTEAIAARLVGHERLVERLAIGVLAGGHLLIEGPPGLAKTRAVKALAAGLDTSFARIQCTPDLMPSDMTGTQVFRPGDARFDFVPGPLFHGLVLVDEINRAPPKVQSALLEAMAERQITAGGVTRPLPDPFMVVATQNSIEHEGTFPLPEAQLDRFLLHVALALPGVKAERAILELVEAEGRDRPAAPRSRLGPAAIHAAQAAIDRIHLAAPLKDFIVRLVVATPRDRGEVARRPRRKRRLSPSTLSLAAAAKARAALQGRDHALPEDVEDLTSNALSHRLVPSWRATSDGITARDIVARALAHVRPW